MLPKITARCCAVAPICSFLDAPDDVDPYASGARGNRAVGMMQLELGTARGLGVNPYNVNQNLAGGMELLNHLLNQFRSMPVTLAGMREARTPYKRRFPYVHLTQTQPSPSTSRAKSP